MTRMLAIPLPDGSTVRLPEPQVHELIRLHGQHSACSWHFNECGCCICLHPDPEDSSRGWIIGPDGGSDYVEVEH